MTAPVTVRPAALVGRKHPALHVPAEPVDIIDPRAGAMARRLMATAHAHRRDGLAVAAPQIGVSLRLVAVLARPTWSDVTTVYANPEIERPEDARDVDAVEGCLSLPGRWYRVRRADRLVVRALDLLAAADVVLRVFGPAARLWAHEIAHLDGSLLSDRETEARRCAACRGSGVTAGRVPGGCPACRGAGWL